MILSGNEPQLLSNSSHLLGNLKEPVPAQTVEENNLPLITAYMWTTLKENVDWHCPRCNFSFQVTEENFTYW